jgi:glucose/arabinose dehydrogenase
MRYAGISLTMLATIAACADDQSQRSNPATSGDGNAGALAVVCAADNGGITLPPGFCATIFADPGGKLRQIAVTPSGHVFVAVQPTTPTAGDDHVLALFDADDNGIAEQQAMIGDIGGNGIAWRDGELFVAANDRIVKYAVPDGALTPEDPTPVVVLSGLPADGDHPAKTVVVSADEMFINIGSPSNTCQVANRQLHSPGVFPCRELATRAGIWRFDLDRVDQTLDCGTQVATGVRNANALALHPGTGVVWASVNGRDQLHENWPELFTEDDDKLLPSEEVFAITKNLDRGWPYCYHDMKAREMKLAPEYGGDGEKRGRCASIAEPAAAIDAHAAPLAMEFAGGTQFPPAFRSGAFVANHGSRFDMNATGDLHGYDVEFLPFTDGEATGEVIKFATGFDAGLRPLPAEAPHRPVGLAMMPDGSLLIGDDKGGRIWRVFYTGQ